MQRQCTVPNGNAKISRRHPPELGHFMLLFRRGRQRTILKVITHVPSYSVLLIIQHGRSVGDPQNVLRTKNQEKFQHFRSQRKKSSLLAAVL